MKIKQKFNFIYRYLEYYQSILVIIALMVISNYTTYKSGNLFNRTTENKAQQTNLYLLEEAKPYVLNLSAFEKKVRQVSRRLQIPPEWLMAVMHSESRFDASVANHKGSGATGLIQWMPTTAKEFGLTVKQLRNLNHTEQLELVFKYLDRVQKRYKPYESLTDVYLAILYPKAIGQDPCYSLYAAPHKAYAMNKGLDYNNDDKVTVQDIDKFMLRIYKTAYHVDKKITVYDKMYTAIGGRFW